MSSAHEKLIKIADSVVIDIGGMADDIDTSYDMYIEELRDEVGVRHHYGVIDMGDAYQGVYTWDGLNWHHDASLNPQEYIDRIIKVRDFNQRHSSR